MTATIAEVFDQDGAIWLKSDPFDPRPFHYTATVRLASDRQLTGGERLRTPCGAVLQVQAAWADYHRRLGAVDLSSEGEGRPPPLEPGMVLEVVDDR